MRRLIGWFIAAALVWPSGPAIAKKDDLPTAPPFLAEPDRSVVGGRLVLANLYQHEIETSIFVDPVARTSTGNLWGDLWLRDMDKERTDVLAQRLRAKAEADISPVRNALRDFDVDGLMLTTTKTALATPDWFQARDIAVTNGPFGPSRIDFLAQNTSAQIVFVRYRYDLSPNFSQIRVLADIVIERKPVTRGKPAALSEAIFRQRVMSIVQLRSSSYDTRDNARRWSAGGGALAKSALTSAFEQFERLIPYALSLSQTQITTLADKKSPKAFAAGYYGTLISRNAANPDDILIWYKGLVHVQPIG
jgi:hypothetical protein